MKQIQTILIIAAIMLLTACSKDSENAVGAVGQEPGTTVEEPQASLRMVSMARSALGVTDYGDIKVYLTRFDELVEGLFKHTSNDEWSTQLRLKSGRRTYDLYGYMPHSGGITSSLSDITSDGAILHINGLDAISNRDYCVVTGVRQTVSATDETVAERGVFSFDYDSNRQNYLNLLFDHLYGRVVFLMKMGEDYSALRSIKIKTMQMQLTSISKVSVDATLKKGEGLQNKAYSITGTEAKTLDIRTEDLLLTTTPTEACSFQLAILPAIINQLRLVTTYEVYDKAGHKIADRTATNNLFVPLDIMSVGDELTLTISVDPTYLYVLADPDLDNPTLTIE